MFRIWGANEHDKQFRELSQKQRQMVTAYIVDAAIALGERMHIVDTETVSMPVTKKLKCQRKLEY